MNVLIVNPYISPSYLSEQLKEFGINSIAVYTQSKDSMVEYFQPNPSWFTRQIFISSDDISKILKCLGDIKIDYVINGFESSVELSDNLAQVLTLNFANNPNIAKYRNDKFLMHQKLGQNNIRHISQQIFNLATDNISEVSQQIKFPCFIKPLLGTASLYSKKVESMYEFSEYFNQLDKHEYLSLLMLPDLKKSFDFLICEFIEGDEYIIDTFSKCGIHHLSSVQQNVKKLIKGVPFYRYTEIIKNNQIINPLYEYVSKCLLALEFNNGFAHSEVLLNENDPCLVEVNPRISGGKGLLNQIATLNGMDSQVDLLAKHIFNLTSKEKTQEFIHYRILYIFNFSLKPVPNLAKSLSEFKTIKEIKYLKPIGYINDKAPKSLMDTVAFIICASNEIADLMSETEEILNLDEKGIL